MSCFFGGCGCNRCRRDCRFDCRERDCGCERERVDCEEEVNRAFCEGFRAGCEDPCCHRHHHHHFDRFDDEFCE